MVTPGQVAKAAGIAQVDEHTDAAWRVVFDAELLRLAQRGVDFTADDVVRAAGLPPASTSPNAVGARVNAAARRGLILPTGALAKGERKARHAGMQRVWRGTGTAKLHPRCLPRPLSRGWQPSVLAHLIPRRRCAAAARRP